MGICRGLVGPDLAEDVVHDAYVRARSRLGQLRDPARFDAWIVRIAVNLCFNSHRASRRAILVFHSSSLDPIAPRPRDYGLTELIERLSPRDRTLIVLHYGYGYSVAEIAEVVGTTANNARSILFRARQRLGERLREANR